MSSGGLSNDDFRALLATPRHGGGGGGGGQKQQQGNKEKLKDNLEKIKLNKQLPYLVGNVVERDVSAARARAARGPPASGVGFPKAGHRGQSRVCTGRGGGWEDSLGRGTGLEGEGWGLLQRTPPNPLPTAPARPSLASLRWPAVP